MSSSDDGNTTPTMAQFRGRTAVITGAGGGIGRALAEGFACHGINLVLADLREDSLRDVAASVEALGVRATPVAVDVSDPESVEGLKAAALAAGDVALVVACAGVSLRPLRPIWENSQADWRWVMDINFWGVLHTVSAFLPHLLATGGRRHVVIINSMSQFRGLGAHAPYVTSKRAVEGYAECLAIDLEPEGVGVSIVYPGRVRTGIATSERLRPEGDRSSGRALTPVEPPAFALVDNPEIEPEEAAHAIIAGVAAGKRYILTHRPPAERMAGRLSAILGRRVQVDVPSDT